MKVVLLICMVALSAILNACTKTTSAAGAYKAKMGAANSEGGDDPTEGGDDPTEGGDDPTEDGGDPTEDGDAAKGEMLLLVCAACHQSGGAAGSVVLDSTAVDKLDTAFTGPNKSNHTSLDGFKTENRADLEAALKAR